MFFAGALFIFIFFNSYQKLSIIGKSEKKGIIISVANQEGISSDTYSYKSYLYSILIEKKTYYSISNINERYDSGSIVSGYVFGSKSFILTHVNNKKIGNKYSFIDYMCFVFTLIIIVFIIYKLIKLL